ncbi:MAG: type II toxin-antitoxin system Phd/YefM family antitoxin [Prevotellaceae bacterium]|jgi:antitoxin YefM|nr:type II toxin-antitoxin system Phd/YefM family antitoxin [Prevotellaceae bacterium]
MRTANYTDLRNNLKSYIESVIENSDTVIINHGKAGIVLMSLDEYNAIRETEYIMSSRRTMDAIRKGEEDIKTGNVFTQKEDESVVDFLKRISCTA